MAIGAILMTIVGATGLLAASRMPAVSQLPDLRSLFGTHSVTGTAPSGSPAPGGDTTPGTTEWSGEAGASGHPLMTREAILSAAANFATCLESLWPETASRGVTRSTLQRKAAARAPAA